MAKSAGNANLSIVDNLANLVPTGSVLAFQALIPSMSNKGSCLLAHKYLALSLIIVFSLVCFLSSFTDSYVSNGKVYCGIATFKGIYIFNDDKEKAGRGKHDHINKEDDDDDKEEYGIRSIDFVHAFCTLLVFLVFATTDSDVQQCFFPHTTPNGNVLMKNLPLIVGAAVSFVFIFFRPHVEGLVMQTTWRPEKEFRFLSWRKEI